MQHDRTPRTLLARFSSKFVVGSPDECWEWTGAKSRGYGVIREGGHAGPLLKAHRVAVELARGPIPEGLQVDHLCRNRACVNPNHLEVVDSRTNTQRGFAPSTVTARTGICQRGHVIADSRPRPSLPGRCGECVRMSQRRSRAKKKRASQ